MWLSHGLSIKRTPNSYFVNSFEMRACNALAVLQIFSIILFFCRKSPHASTSTEPKKEAENSQPHDNPCVNWHKELVTENWLAAAWWLHDGRDEVSAIAVDNDENDVDVVRVVAFVYIFFFCFVSSSMNFERLLFMAHFVRESSWVKYSNIDSWRICGNLEYWKE